MVSSARDLLRHFYTERFGEEPGENVTLDWDIQPCDFPRDNIGIETGYAIIKGPNEKEQRRIELYRREVGLPGLMG